MAVVRHDSEGLRLVDLIGELERRLTGSAPAPGLSPELAATIPEASSYVIVLIDGLGDHQLGHPAATTLRGSRVGVIAAPFPTTTTVSLATVATGLDPGQHGMISHLMWMPDLGAVVNVLKWIRPNGEPVAYPTERMLPEPNLWERLAEAGIEPITVQPHAFARSPLTRALYRGCRFEGAGSVDEAVEATVQLAAAPGRLVLTYFNQVDLAAHVFGQSSTPYRDALRTIDTAWSHLCTGIGTGTVAVATADHGHIDYPESGKLLIRDRRFDDLVLFGDPRALFVRGDTGLIEELAGDVEVTPWWVAERDPWGPGHPELPGRRPDAILLAPAGKLLLPRSFDRRLVGYHGGLDPAEVEVPLLVAG